MRRPRGPPQRLSRKPGRTTSTEKKTTSVTALTTDVSQEELASTASRILSGLADITAVPQERKRTSRVEKDVKTSMKKRVRREESYEDRVGRSMKNGLRAFHHSDTQSFSLPLEGDVDEEDAIVAREVLTRTAGFLRGLGAHGQRQFWQLRDGVATTEAEAAATTASVKAHSRPSSSVRSGQPMRAERTTRIQRCSSAATAASDTVSGSADEGGSGTESSSEPSWVPESDDDGFFGASDGGDGENGKGSTRESGSDDSSDVTSSDDSSMGSIFSDDD